MTHKKFIFFICFIIFAAVIFIVFGKAFNKNNKIAEVYSDGKLIRRIDLSSVTSEYEFAVSHSGRSNTISVKNDSIEVIAADCPDLVCVHTGEIHDSAVPIICLPNRLLIRITDNNASVDTVTR